MAQEILDNFDEYINKTVAGKSDAEVEAELKRVELEQKKLELEYRQADLIVKRDEAERIKGRRAAALDTNRQKMLSLRNFIANREAAQNRCNHRKGGVDARAFLEGQGTSAMYAINKHKLPNGGYMVICARCGKEWHPADKYHVEGGIVTPKPATPGWEVAVNWPSDNTPSTSSTFTFEKTEA
jgi:hypothetical protein